MVKNLTPKEGDVRDAVLIPGSERSPGERNAIHSSIFAWKIPWTEVPGGLQSMGLKKNRTQLSTHTHIRACTFKVIIDIIELMSTMFITFFYSLSEASLSVLSGVNRVFKIILFNLLSLISTSLNLAIELTIHIFK